MPMPRKSAKNKLKTIAVTLTPELIKRLDWERKQDETRSAPFRRLLVKAMTAD